MKFSVLGPVGVSEGGRDFVVGGPKQRAVLALLIVNAGRSVSTGSLIDGVYGDSPPQGARRSIQTYISNLRGEFGEIVHSTSDGYELEVEAGQVDAAMFEAAVANATEMGPVEASAILRDALAMWRGHAYSDVDAGEIVDAEIRRLSELRVRALEARIDADLDAGYHRELIAELESLTTEYPLREHFTEQQMIALYRSGRQAEALRVYERKRNYLIDEMGLDPSSELRTLEQRILEQDPSLAFDTGPMVRMASIVAGDVADPAAISALDPTIRDEMTQSQADAFEEAVVAGGGDVFAHRGTAMYAWFGAIEDAVSATASAQRALSEVGYPMRMAVAIGEVQVSDGTSVQGPPLTRAAQLVATGHGGQVLLSSEANMALVESGDAGWVVRALGQHDIDGSGRNLAVYQLVVDGLPRDFAALRTGSAPAPLPVDVRGLPGYELREQVGSGAFGVVHRAYQPSVGREVAVKIIRPEFANDPDFIRHFEVEAQLVARLEHPHIVPLHDYWRSPDGAYLVMRWLRGGTLQSRIAAGSLSLQQANRLLDQVAPALAFAHRNGVIHRDLKPSNILFDEEGTAYLSDFGIARLEPSADAGSFTRDVRGLASLMAVSVQDTATPEVELLLSEATSDASPFTDVGSFVEAWNQTIGVQLAQNHAPTFTATRNPYKGLQAFGELDAEDFFGRDAEVGQIIDALLDHRFVAVVGPSGIGKSSVTRGGVVPALRSGAIDGSGNWLITDMMPGTYPLDELAAALMRVSVEPPRRMEEELRGSPRGLVRYVRRYLPEGSQLLLVIDQFEELFTLSNERERTEFLSMLSATVADERSNVRVIITMRADFFDRPLRFAQLGEALREGTVPITAPNRSSLLSMITEPAHGVGMTFEAGLADRIATEVEDQPGALPLMQYALAELFDVRSTNTITNADYGTTGGVLRALGTRAEATYTALDPSSQDSARQILLRLVRVSEGGQATRRRVKLTDLQSLGTSTEGVLSAFSEHRLLTFDTDDLSRMPTVEVAHEALLREWPRFAGWISDLREDLILHGRLAIAVGDWEDNQRSDAYLLTGRRLTQHESWTSSSDLALSSAEQVFLAASHQAEADRLRSRRRSRRITTAAFGLAAIVALVLAVAAWNARNASVEQAREARGTAFLASSTAQLSSDPDLAVLLALEAVKTLGPTPKSLSSLRSAVGASRTIRSGARSVETTSGSVTGDLSPDGRSVALSGEGGNVIEVRNVDEGTVEWSHTFDTPPDETEISVQFFDRGSRLVVAVLWFPGPERSSDPPPESVGLYTFDASTGAVLSHTATGACGASMSTGNFAQEIHTNETSDTHVVYTTFSPGVPGCGMTSEPPYSDLFLLDLRTRVATPLVEGWYALDGPLDIALSADASRVVFFDQETDEIAVRDTGTGNLVNSFEAKGGEASFAFTDDGSTIAIWHGSFVRTIEIYDVESGELMRTLGGDANGIRGMVFIHDGATLVTGGGDGAIRFWDVELGFQTDLMQGFDSALADLRFSGDESRLLALTRTGWTVIGVDPAEHAEGWAMATCGGNLNGGVQIGGATTLAFAFCDGSRWLYLRDAPSGEVDVFKGWEGQAAALSPDGRWFVAMPLLDQGTDQERLGVYGMYDAATGVLIRELEGSCERPIVNDEITLPEGCVGIRTYPIVDIDSAPDLSFDAFELAVSADGRFIGAGGWSEDGVVWNAATGELVAAVPGGSVAFSVDGDRVVFFAAQIGALQLYETETFRLVGEHRFASDEMPGERLVFSSDGGVIFGTAPDGEGTSDVVLYDGVTLDEIGRIVDPHVGSTRAIAVSGDGAMIATGGTDGHVRIWAYDGLALVQDIPFSTDRIQALAFAEEAAKLVVSSPNGTVAEVLVDVDTFLTYAESRVTRGFTEAECIAYFPDEPCPELDSDRSG